MSIARRVRNRRPVLCSHAHFDVRSLFIAGASLASFTPSPAPDSGLIFLASETEKVGPLVTTGADMFVDVHHLCDLVRLLMLVNSVQVLCYFVPELGQAPKWCSFLDSITVCLRVCVHQCFYAILVA